jgi:hypothetical protein
MSFKIVVIDDNMSIKEPFIQNIRKKYSDADCNNVFKNPDDGLKFVLENLNSKMIVFIDWNFDGHSKKGIDLLKEIRKKTSLLYIVMMSANQLRDIPLDSIIEMMNEENFFYLDRSNDDFDSVNSIIDKIRTRWSTKFDCVLEQWLIRHPEDNCKEAYSEASTGKTYTWTDILFELRQQTSVGKSFEKKLNEYYIDLLDHSKK